MSRLVHVELLGLLAFFLNGMKQMMSDSVRASAFIVPLQPVRATLYYRQNVREQKDKCKHCKCFGRISPLATILRICCTAQSAYNVYYDMLDLSIYQYRSLSLYSLPLPFLVFFCSLSFIISFGTAKKLLSYECHT